MQFVSTLTCPSCGHRSTETMPADACQFYYECKACGALLRPKAGAPAADTGGETTGPNEPFDKLKLRDVRVRLNIAPLAYLRQLQSCLPDPGSRRRTARDHDAMLLAPPEAQKALRSATMPLAALCWEVEFVTDRATVRGKESPILEVGWATS
ncbi:GDCCVxC domain-containing (seleno)protein [Methylocystis rosea]|uniref:GDCCVxC domain-containing (seleno)protein n=1 Tax=Methylocystis rosea TaxID=173366 RepID=UPI003CC909C3